MAKYTEISLDNLHTSPFKMIGKDWMLICPPDKSKESGINAMTASWGGVGILWNKPVCTLYIRPQRYTYPLCEENDIFSVCFPPEEYRDAMKLCGTKSGRDMDKVKESNMAVSECDGVKYIDGSNVVFICKKLYADDIKEECFIDKSPLSNYAKKDYHRFYICEIVKALIKE